MKKSIIIAIIIAIVAIGGIALFSKKDTSRQQPAATVQNGEKSPDTTSESATLSAASNNELGTFLVASNGMTLYKFTKDIPGSGASACYDQCAVNWPPYTISDPSKIQINPEISGMISTITRTDGALQVTYNGEPLYYWIKDAKPGDTTGQNVGGVWFVVQP